MASASLEIAYGSYPEAVKRVLILDSSFNPPTLAHLAIVRIGMKIANPAESWILLVLSKRNTDKTMTIGDATIDQRVEMMKIMAQELEGGVAVGIIDEPTFAGKAEKLLEPFRSGPGSQPHLVFLVGWDTLIRIFSPRYYSSMEVMKAMLDGFFSTSELICARRGEVGREEEEGFLNSVSYRERITIVDLGDDTSSTAIRQGTSTRVLPRIGAFIRENGLYYHLK